MNQKDNIIGLKPYSSLLTTDFVLQFPSVPAPCQLLMLFSISQRNALGQCNGAAASASAVSVVIQQLKPSLLPT